MRTYSTGYGMNGCFDAAGTFNGNQGVRVGKTVLMVKRRSEITVPAPAYRLVFLDEGRVTPDSYAIHYLKPSWWDPPFVRHADGTNVAFADGHSDYWKYGGARRSTSARQQTRRTTTCLRPTRASRMYRGCR